MLKAASLFAFLFALAAATVAWAGGEPAPAASAPDLVLSGEIHDRDLHHYIEAPFQLPSGVQRLTVVFSQDGASQRTVIDLGLFDPNRFRGWSGGNKSGFTVGVADATPSYLAGPLPEGEWRLVMGVPNIRPGVTTHFRAEVFFQRAGERPAVSTFSDAPLKTGAAWYRGDLHDHNAHSDGSCATRSGGARVPCPAFLTLEAADRRGLDFIAVTDHNTISQYDALRELQPYFDRTLIIPGREITTFDGHANMFGGTDFVDFRLDGQHVRTADELIAGAHAAGGLFSINHPGSPSGEACMGCGWTAKVGDPSKIDSVEVINGGALRATGKGDGPGSGFAFWQGLLDRGFRPTAVGGSDNHNAPLENGVATPTTVVFADALSERAILAGIKAGHVFIDVQGTRERKLGLEIEGPQGRRMMGDAVDAAPGARLEGRIQVQGVAGGRIELVSDAGLKVEAPAGALTADDARGFALVLPAGRHWLYVKVRDAEGRLALVSNPIYFGRGRP